MRKKESTRTAIFTADARQGLEQIIETLNSSSGDELRTIVKQWLDSGPNLSKLFGADPNLWAESQRAFHPSLIATKSGNAKMRLLDNAGAPGVMASHGKIGIRFHAMVLFNTLILNPLWQKLAGPCARCGDFYIKKRASQKVYCSRRCGNAATATIRTRERLEGERKDKLNRAKAVIFNWNSLKNRNSLDWKQWLAEHEPDITTKFVTRNADNLPERRP